MKNKYWRLFYDVKLAFYYYQAYCTSSTRWRSVISAMCTVASMVFVGSWYFSKTLPLLWALLTVGCQIVSVLQPFFPFEKRVNAANYIAQDLNKLALEMETVWEAVKKSKNDEKILKHVVEYGKRKDEIEERFADYQTFPENQTIYEKAKENANTYFRRFCNES